MSIIDFRFAIASNSFEKLKKFYYESENKDNLIHIKSKYLPNLLFAFNRSSYKIIKFLLENGTNINEKFLNISNQMLTTHLIYQTIDNKRQNVYTLLNHGADIYLYDSNGKNALYYAKLNNNKQIIRLIEKKDQENKDKLMKILYKNCTKLDRYCIENIIKYIY